MFRQHFARRFAQSHGSNRKNKYGNVEYYPDDENDPTGDDADRRAIDENVEIACGQRREIDFQIPAQREQDEDPEIVAAQTAANGFPFRDREVWRGEIGGEMLGPRLVSGPAVRHQQVREVARLDNSYATRPDLVVTITTRFHQQKDRDEDRVDRDHEVRVVGRAEDERERRARCQDGPVCRGVESIAPGVRALHFAAIEVDHRGVEFRRSHAAHQAGWRLRGSVRQRLSWWGRPEPAGYPV